MNWKALGFKLLDGFTRTWASFWGTTVFVIAWCVWNVYAPKNYQFDPIPYLLLMGLITILSYMQNIVIMTELKEEKAKTAAIEEKTRQMFEKMFEMVEEIHEEIGDVERQHETEVPSHQKKAKRKRFWRKN